MASNPGGSSAEEEEHTIPRASIYRLIKEILPSNTRVANECRDLIVNCCSEFIHHIASEANNICNQQQKKTINADHVLQGKCFLCLHIHFSQNKKNCFLMQSLF